MILNLVQDLRNRERPIVLDDSQLPRSSYYDMLIVTADKRECISYKVDEKFISRSLKILRQLSEAEPEIYVAPIDNGRKET